MEKTKQIGTIGQMYENRKSGKLGELISREDDGRLNLEDSNGDIFTVSAGTFKSDWRKSKQEVASSEVAETESDVTKADSTDDENVTVNEIKQHPVVDECVAYAEEHCTTYVNFMITSHGFILSDKLCPNYYIHVLIADVITGVLCHTDSDDMFVGCETVDTSYKIIHKVNTDDVIKIVANFVGAVNKNHNNDESEEN